MNAKPTDALTADIERLSAMLGDTIRRLAGEETLALAEEVRGAALALRGEPSIDRARRVFGALKDLPVPRLRALIKAFSIQFDLINLAEQQARIRALRHRR